MLNAMMSMLGGGGMTGTGSSPGWNGPGPGIMGGPPTGPGAGKGGMPQQPTPRMNMQGPIMQPGHVMGKGGMPAQQQPPPQAPGKGGMPGGVIGGMQKPPMNPMNDAMKQKMAMDSSAMKGQWTPGGANDPRLSGQARENYMQAMGGQQQPGMQQMPAQRPGKGGMPGGGMPQRMPVNQMLPMQQMFGSMIQPNMAPQMGPQDLLDLSQVGPQPSNTGNTPGGPGGPGGNYGRYPGIGMNWRQR